MNEDGTISLYGILEDPKSHKLVIQEARAKETDKMYILSDRAEAFYWSTRISKQLGPGQGRTRKEAVISYIDHKTEQITQHERSIRMLEQQLKTAQELLVREQNNGK